VACFSTVATGRVFNRRRHADRVRELGADDEAINNIAVSATYAIWCAAFANARAG